MERYFLKYRQLNNNSIYNLERILSEWTDWHAFDAFHDDGFGQNKDKRAHFYHQKKLNGFRSTICSIYREEAENYLWQIGDGKEAMSHLRFLEERLYELNDDHALKCYENEEVLFFDEV